MAQARRQLRVYLKVDEDHFRFMSIEETAKGYVMLSPRGLTSAQPVEGFRYTPRVFTPTEWAKRGTLQPEGEERLPGRPDHITFHEDRSFHVKQRGAGKEPIYCDRLESVGAERLSRSTPRFLDFMVVGDVARAYGARAVKPRSPRLIVPIKPDQRPIVQCTFSGGRLRSSCT